MKKLFRFTFVIALTLATLVLRASDLPAYAPQNTDLILFANLNRIVNSRLAQKIFAENPDLQQQRDAFAKELKEKSDLDWDEMLNSEICFFANFKALKDPAFQVLAISNSGKAAGFFDHCVNSISKDDKTAVGEVNGVRIIRNETMAFLLLDSRMLQLSYCENNPANVITAPLAKTDPALAKDVDTGAMLSVAVDLANADLPEEIRGDEDLKGFFDQLVKLTLNLGEKGDMIRLTSVATYRDEASAAAARALVLQLNQKMQDAVQKDPALQKDPANVLIAQMASKDMTLQDGCRVIVTSEIDSALAIRLVGALLAASAQ